MSTPITVSGNAATDPELRFTSAGTPVAHLRIASTDRRHEAGAWVDGPTTFLTVKAWNALAEHVAESGSKGDRLLVAGRLAQRDYEHDGEQRSSYEVLAEDVALSLRYSTPGTNRRPRRPDPDTSDADAGDSSTPAIG